MASGGRTIYIAGAGIAGMTLALYMGKSIAAEAAGRLIAAGLRPATPVGIAVRAGRPDRVLVGTTLGALVAGGIDLPDGPAVILVGEAVASGTWAELTPELRAEVSALSPEPPVATDRAEERK